MANRKSASSGEKQVQIDGEAGRIKGIVTASFGRPCQKAAHRMQFELFGIHEVSMEIGAAAGVRLSTENLLAQISFHAGNANMTSQQLVGG